MINTPAKEADALRTLFQRHVRKSQKKFGLESGIGSGSMVYQYLSGRRPLNLLAGIRFASGMGVELKSFSPRLALDLEQALQVLPKNSIEGEHLGNYVRVRCVQLEIDFIKKSFKTKPLEDIGAYIAFRQDWLKARNYNNEDLLVIKMTDEGMKPNIGLDDLLVLNVSFTNPADGMVFALSYEGELRVRRFVRDAGQWWLYCDNTDSQRYPRKLFSKKQCYIIGQVVHKQSENI